MNKIARERRARMKDISDIIFTKYEVSRSTVLSDNRCPYVSRPRMVAMYLLRISGFGPNEIAHFLKRDHSTVIKNAQKIRKYVKKMPNRFSDVIQLEVLIKQQ